MNYTVKKSEIAKVLAIVSIKYPIIKWASVGNTFGVAKQSINYYKKLYRKGGDKK